MASAALYTPEVLALATSLSEFPWQDNLQFSGTARSKSCGSSISLGLSLDAAGKVERVGLSNQACAVGQAASAIFARGACGKTSGQIRQASIQIERWLANGGPVPDWPELELIAPAREYPGRHGAIMLAWKAASEALPSA